MSRRLAYADPPYPGQAWRYPGGREVNLPLLVAHLDTYDGWALSTSAAALLDVWNMAPHARAAIWAKTFACNGWSRVRYTWEAVLFVTDHKGIAPGERSTVRDVLISPPDVVGAWKVAPGVGGGAKPHAFVRWLLALLDYAEGDTLEDLFPGSGAIERGVRYDQLELLT